MGPSKAISGLICVVPTHMAILGHFWWGPYAPDTGCSPGLKIAIFDEKAKVGPNYPQMVWGHFGGGISGVFGPFSVFLGPRL